MSTLGHHGVLLGAPSLLFGMIAGIGAPAGLFSSIINVNLGTYDTGDLLVVLGTNASEGNGIPAFSAGWATSTQAFGGLGDRLWAAIRVTAGGDSLTITYNAAQFVEYVVYRVKNFDYSGGAGVASANNGASAPNAPSVTIPGGPRNALIFALGARQPAGSLTIPSGYSNQLPLSFPVGTVGLRFVTSASSEDAGAFSGTGSINGAMSVAIPHS